MIKTFREYIDVQGRSRRLELIESDVRMVRYTSLAPESLVSVYKDECGHILYIPDSAWDLFGIGSITRTVEVD
jgi:hypothetical protein